MRDATIQRPSRAREILFGVCILCTLWLVLQNSILISWLAQGHGPGLIKTTLAVGRALIGAALSFGLIAFALLIGWASSRAPGRREPLEARHER